MTLDVTTLSNGLRVVTDRMDGLESAAVGVWVGVGARSDDQARTGTSHFLEHMAFKGTASRSAFDIASSIESVGGFTNAYTSRERTAYFARLLGEHVPLAVGIIADILRNPLLAENDVEVERGVILQEIGRYKDSPEDVVDEALQEVAYPDQPMGRTILGSAEHVQDMTPKSLRDHIEEHYRPGRMVLSAAGAVDHGEVVRLAESLFGDMQADAGSHEPAPARYSGGERRLEKDLQQVHLAIGLEAPHHHHAERVAARGYAAILGGGMCSRLFQEVREQRGLCYAIFTDSMRYDDTGMLAVYSGTSEELVPELSRITVREMRALTQDATPDESARVRAQMRSMLLMGRETPFSRCQRSAEQLSIYGRVIPVEETLAEIDGVDHHAVREAGNNILAGSQLSYAIYGKTGEAPKLEELARDLVH